MVMRMGPPYATEHLKLQFSKSKMADGRHLEKSQNHHILATNRQILIKFGRIIQISSLRHTSRQEFEFLKIQDGGRCHYEILLNYDLCNSLTDFGQIWNSDMYGHSGPYRTLKIALFKIQDGYTSYFA